MESRPYFLDLITGHELEAFKSFALVPTGP